ncbi:MAG: hypothetical protein ACKKL4_01970 [Patescibacteria group bacterium]
MLAGYGIIGQGNLFFLYAKILDGGKDLFSNITLPFQDVQALRQENQILRTELENKNSANILAEENARAYLDLWKEFQFEGRDTYIARVIARPPYTAYDQYILKASRELDVDMLVVSAQQYALGYIEQVQGNYSRAQLFSAPREEVIVSIDGVLYTALGKGGGTLEVKLPRSYRETRGVVVKLPGGGPYILGTLSHTEFDPQDSFVRGIISLPINIYTQELVSIVPDTYEHIIDSIENFDANTQTN